MDRVAHVAQYAPAGVEVGDSYEVGGQRQAKRGQKSSTLAVPRDADAAVMQASPLQRPGQGRAVGAKMESRKGLAMLRGKVPHLEYCGVHAWGERCQRHPRVCLTAASLDFRRGRDRLLTLGLNSRLSLSRRYRGIRRAHVMGAQGEVSCGVGFPAEAGGEMQPLASISRSRSVRCMRQGRARYRVERISQSVDVMAHADQLRNRAGAGKLSATAGQNAMLLRAGERQAMYHSDVPLAMRLSMQTGELGEPLRFGAGATREI